MITVNFSSMCEVEEVNSSLVGWARDTDFIRRCYASGGSLLFRVAKVASENIGYVILREEDKESTYLSFIAVKQGHQGQGVGRALMQEAIDKTKERGKKHLVIDCEGHNLGFYKKFGAIDVRSVRSYSNGESKYRISLTL